MSRTLRRFLVRLMAPFTRHRDEARLREELEGHLALQTEANIKAGLSPDEARRQAVLKCGGVEALKDEVRDQARLVSLEQLVQDARHGYRELTKNPGFTGVAVLMLAVAIGVNAAGFTLTSAILFKGFPALPANDRLVYIAGRSACCISYPDFEDWRSQGTSFTGLAAVHGTGVVLSEATRFAERFEATEVSAETFRLLGQQPVLGRDFTASDEKPGATPVAVLSYSFWGRRYNKDPGIVGKSIRLNGLPTTVIGVMGQGFSFPQKQDLWVPLIATADLQKRENRTLWFAFGRLADGVSIDNARAEMLTIGRRLASAYPRTNQEYVPRVRNFREFFISPGEDVIYTSMWGAVGVVLLIACANLANLMLARAIVRSREIAVRMALGAGRWRVIRQLLVESLMLSSLGGLLGWWICRWVVRMYAAAERGPGLVPWRVLDYTTDFRIVAYFAAISIGTGLLFGVVPAIRLSKLDVNATLKDGGRGTTGAHGKRLSGVLVTVEIALAVVLLSGAGVMMHSFLNVYTTNIGVDTSNVLTLSLGLPDSRYPTHESQIAFFEQLTTQINGLPGVESVAIASRPPVSNPARLSYELPGGVPMDKERRPTVSTLIVSPGYFQTFGVPLRAGRDFTEFDVPSSAPVALVNERFASTHWPTDAAVGKRLRLFQGDDSGPMLTVIGVVSNVVQNSTTQEIAPLIYIPYRQRPAESMWVFARTRVPPASVGTAVRRELHALDTELPIWIGPVPVSERISATYWDRAIYGILFLTFAAIALLLASIGLYALMAHSVTQRTPEIGVRLAMGATAHQIIGLVIQRGLVYVGSGLAIGLAASLAVNRIVRAELFQVSPDDPLALTFASTALIISAALGCVIPALRAARVDPLVALRYD
jgi:putative ABC transport system permease protein